MSNSKDDQNKEKSVMNSNRSPPREASKLLSLDVTQEISGPENSSSPDFKIDKIDKNENVHHRNTIVLSGYSSRRVKYKKNEPSGGAVDIDADLVRNDRTLRDEDWFLEKIEKCKSSAFWPPRREYYFFIPPPNDVFIEVNEESEAILMTAQKKKLKKMKRAKKCVPGQMYRFGLSHPCADDVKYVNAFTVKTAKKNTLGCVYIPCPDNRPPRFTLLYSHPNGSDLSDHLVGVPSLIDIARFYRCEVYSYDYSGYGISGGFASEANLYADIRAVYEHITIEKHVDPSRLILLGYSIGSAATVELLRHHQNETNTKKAAGVILQAPPTSILRVIGGMVGRKKHLNKPTCCMDRFVTIDKIPEVEIPILVIHGKEDKTVPIEHGELICQKAVTTVPPEWVPEAAHDNIENCREVWKRIRRFVKV
ncbi:Protein CBG13831 [Caenorhabditis briggsae]|uniref:Protein CBG13831 n=1 Tax=Caenorhabditis briggsae TaxID=6238 RepID=A8XIT1_CAEBR|nr:Protein CBG13831 [Caenorhabditis briggsae]CAP32556.2 Protein CBG13831 [Caenorhabditis briggsae]